MQIEALKLPHCVKLPEYKTRGAAGMDVCAPYRVIDGEIKHRKYASVVIHPGRSKVFDTGVCLAIPHGFVGMVCPRSGLAARYGVTVANAPGIIDSDYRGEIKIILHNHGSTDFYVRAGDRIAQIIIVPTPWCSLVEVEELPETIRGTGGLGSTGR